MIKKLPKDIDDVNHLKINENTEISFAHYYQPNNTIQSSIDIEWIAVKEKDHAILLISKDGLYLNPLNTSGDNCWEKSSLRKWLNDEWVKKSFCYGNENLIIPTSTEFPLEISYPPPYNLPPEGFRKKDADEDYVFILSSDEINDILYSGDICIEPHWVVDINSVRNHQKVKYWARPTGNSPYNCINEDGTSTFCNPEDGNIFVRPAVWIDNFYIKRLHMDTVNIWKEVQCDAENGIFSYNVFRKASSMAYNVLHLYYASSDYIVSYPKIAVEMIIYIAKFSEIHLSEETDEHLLAVNAAKSLCNYSIDWTTIYKRSPAPGQPGSLTYGFIMKDLEGNNIVIDASTFDIKNPIDIQQLDKDGYFPM